MKQTVTLKCKGLFTHSNELSAIPEGAMIECDNVYIDRNDIAEPRRGFQLFTEDALISYAKSLHNYQNRIVLHQSNKLQYESDPTGSPGVFSDYQEVIDNVLVDSVVLSPDETNGLRIKSTEANQNFFFTSQKGIRKIDGVTNSIINPGVSQALDFDLNLVSSDGFLQQNAAVAYRSLWGYKDANNNLILGAPSQREIIYYYANSQFITEINSLINTLQADNPPLTETYTPTVSSTASLETIYSKMKTIVSNLNQEATLTSKDYEAGGTLEKTLITFKPKTLITASSYFLFSDLTDTYYVWANTTGGDTPPDPNVADDLRLNYIEIEVDLSGVVDPSDSEEVAILYEAAISAANPDVNLELVDASLTIRTFTDGVVSATVDGDTATTFFITRLQTGSELEGASITIEALQAGYNYIIELLNAEGYTFIEARTNKSVEISDMTIPKEILELANNGTQFFYQLYRSAQFPLSDATVVVPDDELQLVYENTLSSTDITQGFVSTFEDETTEDFRSTGTLLYTNSGQEGILQANTRVPFAYDVELYKNIVFYGRTKRAYQVITSMLTGKESTAPNDPGFDANTYALLTNQGLTYTSKYPGAAGNSITITLVDPVADGALAITVVGNAISVSLAQAAGVITTTASQLKTALEANTSVMNLITVSGSGASALTALATTNLATGTDGTILNFTKGSDSFNIYVVSIADGDDFANGIIALIDESDKTPSQLIEEMARKIVKAINRAEENTFLQCIYLSGFGDTPGQLLFQNIYVYDDIFEVTTTDTEAEIAFNPPLNAENIADNENKVNRVYFSKFQQPEAVPLVNYFDVGRGDHEVVRLIASRDSLFVFKTDGIFRISGESANSLSLTGFDNTTRIVAPDSADIGNNQIYCLTDQGVSRVTESGVDIISRPIENVISKRLTLDLYPGLKKATFGLFYGTERKYYLWLPDERSDVIAQQAYVFNIFTQTWVRLPITKTCGLINDRDNRLYLGSGTLLHVEQERKDFTDRDYADIDFDTQVISQTYDTYEDTLTLELQSVTDIEAGDVIEQIQYVTPFYFNRVLATLDRDPGVSDYDYLSTLEVTTRDEILTNLEALADKLDADPGVNDTDYRADIDAIVGTTSSDIQTKFNIVVVKLNADVGVIFAQFKEIDQNPVYYTHILEVNSNDNTVVVQDLIDFYIDTVTIYKHIPTKLTWAPNHAGNPAIWKQFSECNAIFQETTCRILTLSFASDASRNYEEIEISDNTLAGWGLTQWGPDPWGSEIEPRAYRTFIPRLKQRSRFINPRFEHARAFERYLMGGISISFMPIEQRVTK